MGSQINEISGIDCCKQKQIIIEHEGDTNKQGTRQNKEYDASINESKEQLSNISINFSTSFLEKDTFTSEKEEIESLNKELNDADDTLYEKVQDIRKLKKEKEELRKSLDFEKNKYKEYSKSVSTLQLEMERKKNRKLELMETRYNELSCKSINDRLIMNELKTSNDK